MRLAEIRDGIVFNVIEVGDDVPAWAAGWPEAGEAMRGWAWDGAIFHAPAPVDPEAARAAWRETRVLSRLEFARGLKAIGILTHDQAMAFIRYEPLPEPITALIATLPEEYRADAEFEMQGARDFPRTHPMWGLICANEGWPENSDVDVLFGWIE